ncbi:MAG: hypothetical protein M0R77_16735 [Gammaproteobacteria bacterium]|nr:hypothetical protein [Gammaproteobacteria bacterium]
MTASRVSRFAYWSNSDAHGNAAHLVRFGLDRLPNPLGKTMGAVAIRFRHQDNEFLAAVAEKLIDLSQVTLDDTAEVS